MEFLAIVGITTIVAISLLAVSNYYSKKIEETIDTNQIDRIAKEIVDTAESMYYFGEPSRATIKVFMPKGIENISIGPTEVTFKFRTESGQNEISYSSKVALQGNLPIYSGIYFISIEAREGYVWINST